MDDANDDWIDTGIPSPAVASITAVDGRRCIVSVEWAAGKRRGQKDVVDLSPLINLRRFFYPLRNDPSLFETVHMINDGFAVAWGDDDAIDMSVDSIEQMAEEADK